MSINRNRAKLNKAISNNQHNRIWLSELYPRYWDEGTSFHPTYRRGYKNPNKYLQMYEVRKYRTWKYNRKNQWK